MRKLLKDLTFTTSLLSTASIIGVIVVAVFFVSTFIGQVNANTAFKTAQLEVNKEQLEVNRQVGEAVVAINTRLGILLPNYNEE